jgi:hypothetical protein
MEGTALARAYVAITAILIAAVANGAAFADAACSRRIFPEIKKYNERISALNKTLPKELLGKQVPSGACVLRGLRLGVVIGLKRTYPAFQQIEDQMACMEIEKFYLLQQCTCGDLKFSPSRDEAVGNDIRSQMKSIRALGKTTRAIGIKNKAIRAYVERASRMVDCFSLETLVGMERIEKDMTSLLSAPDP